jgi:hypothetical protein
MGCGFLQARKGAQYAWPVVKAEAMIPIGQPPSPLIHRLVRVVQVSRLAPLSTERRIALCGTQILAVAQSEKEAATVQEGQSHRLTTISPL